MTPFSGSASRARPLLGTFVEIRIAGAACAMESAFAAVERVHRLMSRHEPQSDVSRLNRAAPGSRIRIDPWTYVLLRRAKGLRRVTEGLFDCGAEALRLEWGAVQVRRRAAITLDGIAKGYAVDRAVDALVEAGVPAGVVNAGGDLRIFGERPEQVHVRDPQAPGRFISIGQVRDAAVASSAGYFANAILVDPRTRRRARTNNSVTVIASDCTTADALTKACLLEPRRAIELASRCDAQVLLFPAQR
jgi:FAD:protein FMN transferase